MSNYYRPYFERDREDRERDRGWDRRREERQRRYGPERDEFVEDAPAREREFGRERFEQFEDWERPRELSSSSFGRYVGRGPKGYQRSDERIKEEVCDRLTEHGDVDASDIEVAVQSGEVTLAGTVRDRRMKRAAEDCVEAIFGVREVQNRIRVGGPIADDPESRERENISGVSRFWRGGH